MALTRVELLPILMDLFHSCRITQHIGIVVRDIGTKASGVTKDNWFSRDLGLALVEKFSRSF